MYSKLLFVVSLGALVHAEASKLAVRFPSIQGDIEVRSLAGRQLFRVPCAELGRKFCGSIYDCVIPGYSCCEWGSQCQPGTYCDAPTAGESGKPGCCQNGESCNRGGGEDDQTDILRSTASGPAPVLSKSSTSIHENAPPSSTPYATSVPSSTSTAVSVPLSVVSASATKTSSVSMPIATGSGSTGAPTNGTVPSAPGLPTQVPGSGASDSSVQAGFVGAVVVIAGLFVL